MEIESASNDGDLDLDMLAASLHADGGDVRILLRALVTRLSGALEGRIQVERAGGFLRKSEEIRRITIRLGDDDLEARVDSGSVQCTIGRSSGGIRIRTDKVAIDEWLRRLLTALRDEAVTSQATRLALESIVMGDPS